MHRFAPSVAWAALTAVAVASYLVLPTDSFDLALPVFGSICALGTLRRAWRVRTEPVLWLAATALTASAGGETLWYLFEHLWHIEPFPSAADVFYLAAYPLLGVCFALLVRREIQDTDRASLIDALIVTAGAGALLLVMVVEPNLRRGGSAIEISVGLAYPLGDLLILAFLTRLLLAPTGRPWPVRLFALATVAMLAADVLFIVQDLHGGFLAGTPVDFGWIAWFGITAAAVSLPLSNPGDSYYGTSGDLPPARLALLGAASLMSPAVLIIEGLRGRVVNTVGVGLVTGAMFLLVLVRMAGLVRQIQAQASTLLRLGDLDPLTTLANRRVWDRELPRAIDYARRTNRVLAVAMIDLDFFKLLNDTHGHAAGDHVLRTAAARWSAELRPGDLLARVGGEEFAVLLPGADTASAIGVIERLRTACPAPMTCSAGIAVLQADETATDLVDRADRALYQAKDAGRDQTILSPPPAFLHTLDLESDHTL